MPRKTRTALTASTTTAVLLLTGCGSNSANTDDQVAGVPDASEQPDAPEEEPEPEKPDDGTDHPEIDLGDHYENLYEDDYTGDPTEDAVLRAIEGWQDATAEAIVSYENDRPALRHYIADEALIRTLTVLDNIYESEESSAGTARYFNHKVTLLDEESATASFCADHSELYPVEFQTGNQIEEKEAETTIALFSARLELNDEEVWQTVDYSVFADEEECLK